MFALIAETTIMDIVFSVAGCARRGGFPCVTYAMAILACRFSVLSPQFELGKRVVKIPRLPRAGVVASLAFHAITTLVFVIFQVATIASLRRFTVGAGFMTFNAF